MASINKVILIGHLGKDPEARQTQDGKTVVSFSLATSDTWKDKATGEKKEKTEWHNLVAFDKLADIIRQYVRKGALIYIEGKLQTRKWQDKAGQDRYTTEIIANDLKMLGGKGDKGDKAAGKPEPQAPAPIAAPSSAAASSDFDDPLPF